MIGELGEEYTVALRKAWTGTVPGFGDLVTFWFAKAWEMMAAGELTRAGLVSTNSIRGGANREVLKPIVEQGRIFEAWSDESWTVDGAAVRVSLISFDTGAKSQGPHQVRADDGGSNANPSTRRPALDTGLGFFGQPMLDGQGVDEIHADLTGGGLGTNLTQAVRLPQNMSVCFEGMKKYGDFDIPGDKAREWLRLPVNVNGQYNTDVLFPWIFLTIRNGPITVSWPPSLTGQG